jgi:hypothetical protein
MVDETQFELLQSEMEKGFTLMLRNVTLLTQPMQESQPLLAYCYI